MGRFLRSAKANSERARTLFRGRAGGPVTVRSVDDITTAVTAGGLVVELAANSRHERPVDRERLRRGIEIRTDDVVVGHLRQDEHHYWRRSRRVLHLVGSEPGRFPAGAHFRLRSLGSLSLETPTGRLIGFIGPTRITRVGDGVGPELLAVFAAVDNGFVEPLLSTTAWRKD